MDIFVELNIYEQEDGQYAYTAVLDSDGEPVVLCDGAGGSRKEALDALVSVLTKTIR